MMGRGWTICFGSYTGSSAAGSDEELSLLWCHGKTLTGLNLGSDTVKTREAMAERAAWGGRCCRRPAERWSWLSPGWPRGGRRGHGAEPEVTPTLLPSGCRGHLLRWGKLEERFRREKSVVILDMLGLRSTWVIQVKISKRPWVRWI